MNGQDVVWETVSLSYYPHKMDLREYENGPEMKA